MDTLAAKAVDLTLFEKILVGALVGALIGVVSVTATHFLHNHITAGKTQ